MRTTADNRPFARVQCTYGLGMAMGEMMADKTKADIASVQASILTPGANVGNVANGAAGTDVVGVDKIRDLLFGNQMQDYDRRFSKLEERFLQRFKDVEADTARNLSAFESNSKKQIESVATQLREEKEQRVDAEKGLERTMREHNEGV